MAKLRVLNAKVHDRSGQSVVSGNFHTLISYGVSSPTKIKSLSPLSLVKFYAETLNKNHFKFTLSNRKSNNFIFTNNVSSLLHILCSK